MSHRQVRARIGKGFIKRVLGGMAFIACIRELIKNSRDWGASTIWINTSTRTEFTITDDGSGMNAENRDAFVSLNTSTAGGARQAGQFCTGAKRFLYSQAEWVRVVTATEETPDKVIIFEVTTEEHEEIVTSGGTIPIEVLDKNAETWPYNHRFGTQITFGLRKHHRAAIKRGADLATKLSNVLSWKFASTEIVRVDDQPLPPREIVGTVYAAQEEHRQLGEVSLEIFRPKKRAPDDDLLLTNLEIGEVPFKNLFMHLPTDLASRVPAVYLDKRVCGTIVLPLIRKYANEDRQTLRQDVGADRKINHFIRLLEMHADGVRRHLRLEPEKAASHGDGAEEVHRVARGFAAAYGSSSKPDGAQQGTGLLDPNPNPKNPSTPRPLSLSSPRQVAVGETFEVTATFAAETHSVDELSWKVRGPGTSDIEETDSGLRGTASTTGRVTVTADLPGSAVSARTSFEIVNERQLELSNTSAVIQLGETLALNVRNADTAQGNIAWSHTGVGSLDRKPQSAVFEATSVGLAQVSMWDSSSPKDRHDCMITVRGKPRDMLCIRGHWFEYQVLTVGGQRPIMMVRGAEVHRLVVNTRNEAYVAAAAADDPGTLQNFLLNAIAHEFVAFELFKLKAEGAETVRADFESVSEGLRLEAFRIVAEVLSKMKKVEG